MKRKRPKQTGKGYLYFADGKGVAPITQSARVIVPLLCDRFHPGSVLDVGCGTGDWLRVFMNQGVVRVRGLDGSWVPQDGLLIPRECFQEVDFYADLPAVEKVDLAVCLEVLEHVSGEVGRRMVSFLCRNADLVYFSAAVPGQGGYQHINEQYQDYWIALFREQGFAAYDLIRPQVWANDQVCLWYKQNSFVFANAAAREKFGLAEQPFIASIIHPALLEQAGDPRNYSLKVLATHLPFYLKRTFQKVVNRFGGAR